MTNSETDYTNGLSVEEAEAAVHRLRLAFSSGTDEELRAALAVVAVPHALSNLPVVDQAVVGSLLNEVSKYFLLGGRA